MRRSGPDDGPPWWQSPLSLCWAWWSMRGGGALRRARQHPIRRGRSSGAQWWWSSGISQAHGTQDTPLLGTWVSQGLMAVGYEPVKLGKAGTGFLTSYDGAPSYLEGLRQGKYTLPSAEVLLVVVEGGDNDEDYPTSRSSRRCRLVWMCCKNTTAEPTSSWSDP